MSPFHFQQLLETAISNSLCTKSIILAQPKSTGTSLLAKAEPEDTKHSIGHTNRGNTLPITEPLTSKDTVYRPLPLRKPSNVLLFPSDPVPKGLHLLFCWQLKEVCSMQIISLAQITVAALISIQEQQYFFLEYSGPLKVFPFKCSYSQILLNTFGRTFFLWFWTFV